MKKIVIFTIIGIAILGLIGISLWIGTRPNQPPSKVTLASLKLEAEAAIHTTAEVEAILTKVQANSGRFYSEPEYKRYITGLKNYRKILSIAQLSSEKIEGINAETALKNLQKSDIRSSLLSYAHKIKFDKILSDFGIDSKQTYSELDSISTPKPIPKPSPSKVTLAQLKAEAEAWMESSDAVRVIQNKIKANKALFKNEREYNRYINGLENYWKILNADFEYRGGSLVAQAVGAAALKNMAERGIRNALISQHHKAKFDQILKSIED